MNTIDLFCDPRNLISEQMQFPQGEPEMTEFESAFLCGLIKAKKPRKIVEVGVAAGGTTAIILQCLEMLGLNETSELYSVDICELFYRGNGEKTGYLAEIAKDKLDSTFQHKYYLGKTLPSVLDEIGMGVDFVILDTTHSLPGEVLEFLAIYPYLSLDACVVLHDIANNHYGRYAEAFATQLLMDSVVAEKIVQTDSTRAHGYPNIGAFVINKDTPKYLEDVFRSLMVTWNYIPSRQEFESYLSSVLMHYDSQFYNLLNKIYLLQTETNKKHVGQEIGQDTIPEWRKSTSYMIGRTITYIPRKIKQMLNYYRRPPNKVGGVNEVR